MGIFDDHFKLDPLDRALDVNLDGEVNDYDYYLIEEKLREEQESVEADRERLDEIDRGIEERRRLKEEKPFDLDTFLAENRGKSQSAEKTTKPAQPAASGGWGACLLYILFFLIGGGVIAALLISLFGL